LVVPAVLRHDQRLADIGGAGGKHKHHGLVVLAGKTAGITAARQLRPRDRLPERGLTPAGDKGSMAGTRCPRHPG
jgi:hypothetical protein